MYLFPFVLDSLSIDTLLADNYIIIPKRFSLLNDWYSINGSIKLNGLMIDTLSFNNEMTLTLGSKSMGIFKKPKPIVLIEYSNPYVRTEGLQNIIIKDDLRFYDRKGFWYGVGVATGVLIPVIINK